MIMCSMPDGMELKILRLEAAVVRTVTHSFFVSKPLAERAVRDYGVPRERVTVSPNATDESFLKSVTPESTPTNDE